MSTVNRLATPLPDSILDRYFAEHPDEVDHRQHKHGAKTAAGTRYVLRSTHNYEMAGFRPFDEDEPAHYLYSLKPDSRGRGWKNKKITDDKDQAQTWAKQESAQAFMEREFKPNNEVGSDKQTRGWVVEEHTPKTASRQPDERDLQQVFKI
jgi:hypothetical protein